MNNLRHMTTKVPASLKTWFTIHFAVDYIFGLPLIFAPKWTMALFGFEGESFLTARLVGAALLGIGGISLLAKDKNKESYMTLLRLKQLWSGAALLAIGLSILEGAPTSTWIFFVVFALFAFLWNHYLNILKKKTPKKWGE